MTKVKTHPLSLLRSLIFKATYYGWTFILCITLLWAFMLPIKQFRAIIRSWLHQLGWIERNIGGIRMKLIGIENIPKSPCLVAAKHQSLWETFKLRLIFNDPAIVLKRELVRIPLWGWYLARSGVIPIDRRGGTKTIQKMIKTAQKAVEEGRHVLIFPEGTRRSPDSKGGYKQGVSLLYKALNIPLVPVALNSGVLWPKNQLATNTGEITIEILPPIKPGIDRKEMMEKLENEMETATHRLVAEAKKSLQDRTAKK